MSAKKKACDWPATVKLRVAAEAKRRQYRKAVVALHGEVGKALLKVYGFADANGISQDVLAEEIIYFALCALCVETKKANTPLIHDRLVDATNRALLRFREVLAKDSESQA